MKTKHLITRWLGLAIIFFMASEGVWGGETNVSPLSLATVMEVVQRDNPEIKAARERWRSFAARVAQSATPDKPRLEFERMYSPRGKNVWTDAEEKNIVISQEIPFPTTLYYASRRARQEAEEAEAGFQAKELDVLSRAKRAYSMLYLSHHAIQIFKENADLMGQFSKVAEARYAAGKATQSDALKAQVELSKMLNELVSLQQEKEINAAMLNTLLNRSPESPLGIPQEPNPQTLALSLAQLEAQAVESRPDLRGAALAVEKSRTQVTLGRSDYLPDLMLQYRRRDMADGMDSHDAMVGFTLPLWFWKQGARVREARAERDMALAEYQSMKNMTHFDVKSLLVKVQTSHRLAELYQTSVLPQAEHALNVTSAAYRADKMSFLELLDAVRSLLQFRLEYYEHLSQYEQFKAELERVVGVDLVSKEKGQ
ncbi:MAG: TolC family protein [Elusimicrobia bacterium]|nr:TolC family protein [Elusimicrobiota bacterium]